MNANKSRQMILEHTPSTVHRGSPTLPPIPATSFAHQSWPQQSPTGDDPNTAVDPNGCGGVASTTSLSTACRRVNHLQKSIDFLNEHHTAMLRALHIEIESLKQQNRELQFLLIFSSGNANVTGGRTLLPDRAAELVSGGSSNSLNYGELGKKSKFVQVDLLKEVADREVAAKAASQSIGRHQAIEKEMATLTNTLQQETNKNAQLQNKLTEFEKLVKTLRGGHTDRQLKEARLTIGALRRETESLKKQVGRLKMAPTYRPPWRPAGRTPIDEQHVLVDVRRLPSISVRPPPRFVRPARPSPTLPPVLSPRADRARIIKRPENTSPSLPLLKPRQKSHLRDPS